MEMSAEVKNKTKKKSQAAMVWRRLKKNKMAVLGLIILAIIIPVMEATPPDTSSVTGKLTELPV